VRRTKPFNPDGELLERLGRIIEDAKREIAASTLLIDESRKLMARHFELGLGDASGRLASKMKSKP
jgi:hypothetical protein